MSFPPNNVHMCATELLGGNDIGGVGGGMRSMLKPLTANSPSADRRPHSTR
jgi:hypothetical protein